MSIEAATASADDVMNVGSGESARQVHADGFSMVHDRLSGAWQCTDEVKQTSRHASLMNFT